MKSTEKRLFQYAMRFKKGIIIGVLFLMISTTLELAGPFIAKTIIDNHVLAIEGTWEIVPEREANVVKYQDRYYLKTDQKKSAQKDLVTIFAVGKDYYLYDGVLSLKGKREILDGDIYVNQAKISAQALGLKDIYHFFKPQEKPIIYWLLLYFSLLLIAGIFQYYQTYLLQKSSNLIVERMRNDVFQHIQKIPIPYFTDQPAGKIVARVTNDTEAIRDLFERVFSIVTTRVIYMLGILIAIFILDIKTGFICLAVVPLVLILARIYKYFGSKYNLVIRKTNSEINGNINEAIQGMSIIQAFNHEVKTQEEFNAMNDEIYTYQRKNVRLNALTSFNIVNILRNLTAVAFIFYFGNLSLEPSSVISIGMLYALVDYLTRFFEPITAIVNQFPLIEQARASGDRMFQLMDEPTEAFELTPIPRYQGKIEFDDVTFAYEAEKYILKNITFNVEAGETAAFVGHTGSGKSSIMNLLFRFYDPQFGRIMIDDHSIHAWSRQQVRGHMGIVLQDPFLFSGDILSNVTMNDPKVSHQQAIQALKAVGADSFIERLPQAYREKVTEGGTTFSLGERQLISFARALAFDPAILILDEATANIDTETEMIIQKALDVLQENRTTLIIAHRLSTIQKADKIFVLEAGQMIESGNHASLIAEKGRYYEMFQMQKGQKNVS